VLKAAKVESVAADTVVASVPVLEEIGPRLRVRQIIIYTAIIFYRRFYQT
jgi:hypothetical protein